MHGLRPYQEQAIKDIRDTVRGGVKRLIVQAATGAGKTKIAASIINMAREKRNCVAFVVPAVSLVEQTMQVFYKEGIRDVGIIQANHPMENWAAPVQICSIQTLRRRGAYVALGGLHVTSLPDEAAQHADTIFLGPGEDTWPAFLADFRRGCPARWSPTPRFAISRCSATTRWSRCITTRA